MSECRDRSCFACTEGAGCCRCDATVLEMSERVASLETKLADLQTALNVERGLRARKEEALRRLIRGPHVIAHLYGCGARRDSEPCDCGADALYDEIAAALAK